MSAIAESLLNTMVAYSTPCSVSADNVLSGMNASASSYDEAIPGNPWLPETATDGKAVVTDGEQCDWVTHPSSDTNPRLAVWGINGGMNTIRIWGAGDLDPDVVEIRSSTSLITPTTYEFPANLADSYETVLVEMTSTAGAWIADGMAGDRPWQMYYIDYAVNVPAGTQSLLFDFGDSGRTRIVEVQGFMTPALPGDANNNGVVDAEDAAILASNWQMQSGAAWGDGDFNGDNKVDEADATILAANWQSGVSASVPEPGMMLSLFSGLLCFAVLSSGIHNKH